ETIWAPGRSAEAPDSRGASVSDRSRSRFARMVRGTRIPRRFGPAKATWGRVGARFLSHTLVGREIVTSREPPFGRRGFSSSPGDQELQRAVVLDRHEAADARGVDLVV